MGDHPQEGRLARFATMKATSWSNVPIRDTADRGFRCLTKQGRDGRRADGKSGRGDSRVGTERAGVEHEDIVVKSLMQM